MPCENLVALMFSAQALGSGKQLRGAGTFGAGAVSDDRLLGEEGEGDGGGGGDHGHPHQPAQRVGSSRKRPGSATT